jgi:lipoprotein-releasing system permease protein
MSRLPFEAFLALRYLRPRRTFVSVITVISIIGVLLGVAVLIVVIAVMSGFDKEWRTRILGFNAHLKIYSADHYQSLTNYESIMRTVKATPDVVGVSPFIESMVLAQTEPDSGPTFTAVPTIIGVDPETIGSVNVLPKSIVSGKLDVDDKGLVVGQDFAARLGLNLGDRLSIYSANELQKMHASYGKTNQEVFLPDDFTVRGIFDVGFPDYNGNVIVTSLADARELQTMPPDSAQGLQIKLTDPFLADKVAEELTHSLRNDNVSIYTWRQENPEIFNALAVEKNMMFYMLFFIVIVAGFGIVNCQITFVVQKTREIGILKSLGASRGQILWLFLSQSIVVGLLGVGLGFGLAMLALAYRNEFLEFMRRATGMQLLPASIYHVYDLPASIQAPDIALICCAAFLTCVLAGLFPAWKASRLQPVEALRYG